ncbi:MAG: DUF4167 domain-containing protein [Pseudomonadota bacterium]
MKSTRSRSRSKNNRNRNQQGGNIVNRVFDSSGPEGKVRGTPQQVIEKYNQLARDAHLSNDRVAAENFQQHAEHYLRILADAQREQEQRRAEQERLNRERQAERDRERAERQERDVVLSEDSAEPTAVEAEAKSDVAVDDGDAQDTGLVDTPESAPKRAPRRKPKTKVKSAPAVEPTDVDDQPEAAE